MIVDFIEDRPWISLAIAWSVVTTLGIITTGIHAITVTFVAFAVFAFFLHINSQRGVTPIKAIPGTKNFSLVQINRKELTKYMNGLISKANSYADGSRDGLFLGNANNVYTPAQLEEMARSDDKRIQAFAALNPLTSVTVLESLSHSKDLGVLNAVASNKRTPTNVRNRILYTKIFDTNSEEAQRELLTDPETPTYVLENIYNNPFDVKEVYTLLIAHPNTSKDLFRNITSANNLDVLKAIGSSPALIGDNELITKLKNYSNHYEVVESVLTNPYMDTRTLDLYKPTEEYIRPNLNIVVRNEALELQPATMAWIARNAPTFKNLMISRLKMANPELADFPTDAILKLY